VIPDWEMMKRRPSEQEETDEVMATPMGKQPYPHLKIVVQMVLWD
jgi:hypothetical protein